MNPVVSFLLRIVLTIVGFLISFLPRWLEIRLGQSVGVFFFYLGIKRIAVAKENLRHCYPKMSEKDLQELLKKNFAHYGCLLFEFLHLFSPVPGHYRRYICKLQKLEGFEHWQRANEKGKGIIFVSAHLGNWEVMVGAGANAGIPLTMVTKHLKPEWLHKKIESSRLSLGVKGAYEPRTLPIVMRALRKGESIGFVMDQYAGPPIGIPVPFFGVKVGTLAAVSILVERTGAAVVPVRTYRNRSGRVHVCIEPELDLSDVASDNERCTAVLTAHVENWVRQLPEQWLWVHRRFKNVVWPKELP